MGDLFFILYFLYVTDGGLKTWHPFIFSRCLVSFPVMSFRPEQKTEKRGGRRTGTGLQRTDRTGNGRPFFLTFNLDLFLYILPLSRDSIVEPALVYSNQGHMTRLRGRLSLQPCLTRPSPSDHRYKIRMAGIASLHCQGSTPSLRPSCAWGNSFCFFSIFGRGNLVILLLLLHLWGILSGSPSRFQAVSVSFDVFRLCSVLLCFVFRVSSLMT